MTERPRTEEMLLSILKGVSGVIGEAFFRSLVEHVCSVFEVRCALVGELLEGTERIRTLAVWSGEGLGENFEYDLAGTPCENVVNRDTCIYPEGVQELFPEDHLLVEMGAESYHGTPLFDSSRKALGVLVLLDDKPMAEEIQQRSAILGIFAGRAAAEIERIQTGDALRASEARYRDLVNSSPDVVWRTDSEGVVTYLSPAATAVLRRDASDLIGKPYSEFLSANDAARVHSFLWDDPGDGPDRIDSSLELTMRRKDGTEFIGEIRAAHIVDAEGEKVGMQGTVRDITERKKAEEDLLRLSAAIECVAESIFVVDLNAVVEYVNPAFERITGYGRDEIVGRHSEILRWEHIDPSKQEAVLAALRRKESWTGRYTSSRRDGTSFQSESTFSPVLDESGQVTGYVGVQRDITEELRVETQLRQKQKMEAIGQLAGGVAHDFNNLLQAITGYTDFAMEDLGDAHPARKNLDQVMEAADRAGTLVRQLLTFSRAEPARVEVVDLNGIIEGVMKMLGRVIGENVELNLVPEHNLDAVNADPGQMEQVLMNLCVNARDAMAEGGRITIETGNIRLDQAYAQEHPWARVGDFVFLSVADEGVGMSAEDQERIFEPFFTTKEAEHGTGLGLATVYGIVKQHDGLVSVYSEVGEGTVFRLYFPSGRGVPAGAGESMDGAAPLKGGTETILLAEDDELVRDLVRRVLEGGGYRVIIAQDGEEAIALFEEHNADIDLALLDVIMPKKSGLAVWNSIRARDPKLPVLLCSGYSRDRLGGALGSHENVQLILKPLSPNELLRKVRELLDAHG